MSETIHVHDGCGQRLLWRLNEILDDFGWWCGSCEEWVPEDEVKKVVLFDRDDIAYERARARGWPD